MNTVCNPVILNSVSLFQIIPFHSGHGRRDVMICQSAHVKLWLALFCGHHSLSQVLPVVCG